MFNTYPFDKPEPEVFNDLYQQSLKIEPKEPKDPTGQKTAVRKPLVAVRIYTTSFEGFLAVFSFHYSSFPVNRSRGSGRR